MGPFLKRVSCFWLGICTLVGTPSLSAQPPSASPQAIAKQTSPQSSLTPLPALTYHYEIKGLPDTALSKEFKNQSNLVLLKERPLYSSFALWKRTQEDKEVLQKLLYAVGYYDAALQCEIKPSPTQETQHQIIFSITPGARYKVKTLKAHFDPAHTEPAPYQAELQELGLGLEENFSAEQTLTVFEKFKEHLTYYGYPFAKILGHEAILSRRHKTVTLIVNVNPGPYVKFGTIDVKSTDNITDIYIKNRAPFTTGETYDQRQIEAYQDKLSKTKLFKKIQIKHQKTAQNIEDGDKLPLEVTVSEAKPRTIMAGIKFGTTEGIGTKLSWTHRNLTGRADKFMAAAEQSQRLTFMDITYHLPDFLKIDQTLITTTEYKEERTKAFKSRGYGLSMILNHEFQEGWHYTYGLGFERVRLSQYARLIHVTGLSLPLGFRLNTQDDNLNPSTGGKLMVDVIPEYGQLGGAKFITRTHLYGVYHIPLLPHNRTILALWSRAGFVFGGHLNKTPGDRRFFSGGGGSLRGYGHQMASPLDNDGKPLGGKSLFEWGLEPRFKVNENWGLVAFLEGGLIGRNTYPTLKNRLLWSVGTGVRYYTPLGPIRADIAVPLRKRRKENGKVVDRSFQFYLSIGQSF